MLPENADQIRERLRAARSALSPRLSAAYSRAACQHLIQSQPFQTARHLAGFLAFDGECDPQLAMTSAVNRGCAVYVPILDDHGLQFAPWAPDRPVRKNRFGIDEPVYQPDERIDVPELDLVLAPLVAFDAQGHRLGMGGGYYDRTFAFLASSPRPDHPRLVGIAYDLQRIPAIQAQPWDVALDAVVTESGWMNSNRDHHPANGDSS